MSQPCPILLINLDRSKARLESAVGELARFGFEAERIRALDGEELGSGRLAELAPPPGLAFFRQLSAGEVGCFLSHLEAARCIVERRLPVALVLEDDLRLGDGFATSLRDSVAWLAGRPDVDLVRLDTPIGVRGGMAVDELPGGVRILLHRRPPSCTTAMLWTLAGARRMLGLAPPLSRPVDVQLKHWWEGDFHILALSPPPVLRASEHSLASTIRRPSRLTSGQKLRRLLYKLCFSLRSHLEMAWRRGIRTWIRCNLG